MKKIIICLRSNTLFNFSVTGGVYFTGAKLDIAAGTFSWTDGTLMDYASWWPDQPNDLTNQVCLIIETAYEYDMSDVLCTNSYKYICQK